MLVRQTPLPGVLVVEPKTFRDERGFFLETYQRDRYKEAGIDAEFVQDNASRSTRGTLRGLHLQHPNDQTKLVYVLEGEVFDVAVDVRLSSPMFAKWHGEILTAENSIQLFIPEGFAHGFCVLSETALFAYKCTAPYAPTDEITIAWNDPLIGIEWPVAQPNLSSRDAAASSLEDLTAKLPRT